MSLDQRRAFLQDLVRWGAGAAAAPAALAAFAESVLADDSPYVEVKHYRKLEDKRIQCHVCPLNCLLDDGFT